MIGEAQPKASRADTIDPPERSEGGEAQARRGAAEGEPSGYGRSGESERAQASRADTIDPPERSEGANG